MAVLYRLYQSNKEGDNKGKWYARALMTNEVDTEELAEIIQRNCTVKRSDVLAVITELVEVMQDELQNSHKVKLNGFGSFKIGMKTKPSDTAKKFNVNKNVVGLHVNFVPEQRVSADHKRTKTFLTGCTVQEAPKNNVVKEEEETTEP